jgi:ABC-2 type transport system ATP-binding protein
MKPAIEFCSVERRFGERSVLRELSFAVAPGEVYALLGRNGAGKTTALRILLGLLEPMSGSSRLLGESSGALSESVRARVSWVSEDHALYGWMRVEEALAYEAATRSRFELARANAWRARLALDPRQRVDRLSRGQRAQLALLTALCARPEVLVLDDPALGLDAVVRRELLGTLAEWLADAQASVLYTTHALTDVERVADRVGILHQGALILDAPLDELKRRVSARFVRTPAGASAVEARIPRCLSARSTANGVELLLLDSDAETERALREFDPRPLDARSPNLEELFVELTGAPDASPPAPTETHAHAHDPARAS